MKKVLVYILLFFQIVFLNANAQGWCPPGAEWHYTAQASIYPGFTANGFIKFKYVNDVFLMGNWYKQIDETFEGYCVPWYGPNYQIVPRGSYYARENNGVILTNNDTVFNFNANIGDKWLRPANSNTICDAPRRTIQVLNTGTVSINSITLKSLTLSIQFKFIENSTLYPLTTQTWVVNERLNLIEGLTLRNVCEYLNPQNMPMHSLSINRGASRCYSDNNLGLYVYPNYTNTCNYINTTAIKEFDGRDQLILYPNPAKEYIAIQNLQNYKATSVAIYNNLGEKVYQQILEEQTENLRIPIINLNSGIYFVCLTNRDLKTFSQKLIVN